LKDLGVADATGRQIVETSQLPQIIYIMGTGRSGTTILEILLSNNTDVTGVGEVTHIFQDGYINDSICSCGEPVSICSVWNEVKNRCQWSDDLMESYNSLFVNVSWHTKFPSIAMGRLSIPLRSTYRAINNCLFTSVAEITNSSFVVDSSKYAGRALELARLYPDNVKVICLTRTPEGLVNAFTKKNSGEQPSKSLLGIILYYIYTMACFRVVKLILGKRALHIQFEDLASAPATTLEKIQTWSKADLGQVIKIVKENQWLNVGHIVTGNRLRMLGKLQFRSSHASEHKHGILTKAVILFMSAYKLILGF